MEFNLTTLFNVLAEPPGDLIFHLVVSMSLLLLMAITVINRKITQNGDQSSQSLVGYGVILLLQLLLFVLRPLSINFLPNGNFIYPLYERLAATLTIIWLVYLFYDHEEYRIPNYLTIFLSVALIVFAGVSILVLPRLAQLENFNILSFDLLWQLVALTLTSIGLALAIINPPPHQIIMIIIFSIIAVGHILQIFMYSSMQWNMGAIRFAQTLSLPWLLVLIQSVPKTKTQTQKSEFFSKDSDHEERLYDTKPDLTNHLLKVGLSHTNNEKYQAVAQALSLSVIADICFLVKIHEEDHKLNILTGYDLIRETIIKPDTLDQADLPHIMEAWQANKPLQFSQDRAKSKDVVTLKMLLQYQGIGNLFAYPLGLPNKQLVGGVIFLSPYTGKSWGNKTMHLLDEIKDTLGLILFSPGTDEQTRQELQKAQNKVSSLINEQQQLHQAITEKENKIKELQAKYQVEQLHATTSTEQLKSRIKELTSKLASQQRLVEQLEQMEKEIRQLTSEREKLNLALSRAKTTIKDLQTQTGQTGPIRLSLDSQIISLDSIAANIRLQVASQLKQKDIDLEIHNPDGRFMVKTDPELLQTALLELITNATKASAPSGTIRLDQKLSLEMGVLIIQVTDFGEGLSQMEQTDLFSGQHDSIPGVGDVHCIRKAIRAIRVLNGKIWLKSRKASYTTFRVQIPVRIID